MKLRYLFPARYKKAGWFIFIPALLLGLLVILFDVEPGFLNVKVFALFDDGVFEGKGFFKVVSNNILNEILGVLIIAGGLLVAFSKEKDEDEFIGRIRLESLVWATYVNYGVLLLSFLFVYGLSFFWVMIVNMYTILIFFVVRFNLQLRKLKNSGNHEE